MKKGYWTGHVFEVKDENKWNNYLTQYFQIEEKHQKEKHQVRSFQDEAKTQVHKEVR